MAVDAVWARTGLSGPAPNNREFLQFSRANLVIPSENSSTLQ
jgi:hypothetical protein